MPFFTWWGWWGESELSGTSERRWCTNAIREHGTREDIIGSMQRQYRNVIRDALRVLVVNEDQKLICRIYVSAKKFRCVKKLCMLNVIKTQCV